MQYMKNISLLPLLIILLFGCSNSIARANEPRAERFAQEKTYYEICKFVDGDTFWITDGKGRKEKIRFIGIDTPEPRSVGKKKKQPYGEAASAFVKRYLKGKKSSFGI